MVAIPPCSYQCINHASNREVVTIALLQQSNSFQLCMPPIAESTHYLPEGIPSRVVGLDAASLPRSEVLSRLVIIETMQVLMPQAKESLGLAQLRSWITEILVGWARHWRRRSRLLLPLLLSLSVASLLRLWLSWRGIWIPSNQRNPVVCRPVNRPDRGHVVPRLVLGNYVELSGHVVP